MKCPSCYSSIPDFLAKSYLARKHRCPNCYEFYISEDDYRIQSEKLRVQAKADSQEHRQQLRTK